MKPRASLAIEKALAESAEDVRLAAATFARAGVGMPAGVKADKLAEACRRNDLALFDDETLADAIREIEAREWERILEEAITIPEGLGDPYDEQWSFGGHVDSASLAAAIIRGLR